MTIPTLEAMAAVIDKGHIDEKPEPRWLTGRAARRARANGDREHNPNRSRCQRLTAQQRRDNRKVRAHEARKAKRRARRQAAEVAA
ncbi:hypothetical protein [Mycobacterium sp. 1245801.1]|uniref:hypothetical protein n=1 Tax=Mycobacterium sp. 1245801.1 TaxID=1834075 RepID=UPI0008010FD9|nr:hypothetical protein [Mycobacterium sp. 1245801.1]OBJ15566.1 hypothetical protein A5622_26600 [Mycobacterium sp. 1245801.1]